MCTASYLTPFEFKGLNIQKLSSNVPHVRVSTELHEVPTCREVLCTGVVVVARDVGVATVVTMQGSCFSVVSSRDSALMNWGCSNT